MNVIYQFTCPKDDCMHRGTNYIGIVQQLPWADAWRCTKPMKRLSIIKARHNNSNLTKENIVRNTVIIRKHSDAIRLLIHEAFLIKFKDPNLNRQDTGNTRIPQLYFENSPVQNSN